MTLNPQLIRRVDVEDLLITDLTAWLVTVGEPLPVSDELAAGERAESVALYRTGGPMASMTIDNPTIALEVKGVTKTRSAYLIHLVDSWLHGLAGFELGEYGVTRVQEFAGPALNPVPDSPTRYTQALSLEIQTQLA